MMWLLVDGTYLAYRAWYAIEHLSYKGEGTTVAFGFIRELDKQREIRQADRVVLAFDHPGRCLRRDLFEGYKESRRMKYAEDDKFGRERQDDFRKQLKRLVKKILPALGYRNVLAEKGYEADDIIAKAAEELPLGDKAVIVTADKDMWQCLTPTISWFNPQQNKLVTSDSFREEWGIEPVQWASVKALAGCSTDDVPGIEGIGEKTAAKWFAGTLKSTSKVYQKIVDNLDVHNRNMPLVKLPFDGLKLPKLFDDKLTDERRADVFDELGFKLMRKRERTDANFST